MPDAGNRSWERRAVAAFALAGGVWAVVAAFLHPETATEDRLLVIALTFAVTPLASLTNVPNRRAVTAFTAILTASAIIQSLSLGTLAGYGLALFALAYGAALIGIAGSPFRMLEDVTQARHKIAAQQEQIAMFLGEHQEPPANWQFVTDADGRLCDVSTGLTARLGLERLDLIGKPFPSCLGASAGDAGWNRLQLAITTRQPVSCAVELIAGGTSYWWQLGCEPRISATGEFEGHSGTAYNITAERHARRQLTAEKQQLAEDNARRASILENVALELRSPVTTILGYSEILKMPGSPGLSDTEFNQHLLTILETSRRISAFIADIHDFARYESGTLHLLEQEVDAAELVEIAVKLCHDQAEASNVDIVANVFDGIELRCDAARITRIFVALVARAIQASPAGSAVKITFERTPEAGLAFAIHDSGAWTPPENNPGLFEPDTRGRGMEALALPIARRIAMLHGGTVTVDTAGIKGTTSRLIMPPGRVSWAEGNETKTDRAA